MAGYGALPTPLPAPAVMDGEYFQTPGLYRKSQRRLTRQQRNKIIRAERRKKRLIRLAGKSAYRGG